MSQVLISIVAFVIALSVLVAVHEFGHFWVARRLGVKVLRFSIGFGKILWRYRRSEEHTEFVISAIPLGGYVKMLDEREGEVPAVLRAQAFNTQSVWKRIAIVLGGPVFNLLLAAVLYALVFVIGINGLKPVVGEPGNNTPAALADFEIGDTILKVAGQQTRTWQEVQLAILDVALEHKPIEFEVITRTGQQQRRHIPLSDLRILNEGDDVLDKLGLIAWRPAIEPVIDSVITASAAYKAGLQSGDRILSVDNNPVVSWNEWAEYVRARPGQIIHVNVSRQGQVLSLLVTPNYKQERGAAVIGFIGAAARLPISEIEALKVTVQYPLLESIGKGIDKTAHMITLILRMMGKLIIGDASLKNISGPISMADYAGKAAQLQLSYFLDFLAIISLSLGVMNLLPIPLLDGGHLLYYLLEIIKGSPVSEKAQMLGQQAGIFILGCLMALAFYNDVIRLWER